MPPEQMDQEETAKPREEDIEMQAYYPGLFGCRNAEREFDFLNKIEEGTYGVVFRAYEKRTGKVMALKRLKTEEDEDFPITSLREINTLLKCRGHPNIINVQEVVCNAAMSQVYLVMEYVEHDTKSFMELMRKKDTKFTLAQVKALMRQLLSGLARIHEEFIIHRDLKPSNLLLSHGGVLKIGDFGLARKFDDPLRPYTPVVVTLWYRCPELLLGTKLYSTAVDMWSVGCIFAEFLKLQALFPGKSELDQLSLIFSIIGSPSSENWPGFDELPYVKKMRVPEVPFNCLREKYNRQLEASEAGVDMLKSFLAHFPKHRMSAEEALKSSWFTEDPEAAKPEDFPLYPAKSERNKRPRAVPQQDVEVSPGRLKMLAAYGVDAKSAPKAGFQLKFGADEPAAKKHKRR